MYGRFPMLPFYESVGAIPSSYLVSLSYEEQILWLCSQIQAIKEGTPNYNYELLENKPKIGGIELIGNKTLNDLGIQEKLVAGSGIEINGNVISTTGGGGGSATSYNSLDDKPQINHIILRGDKDGEELGLQNELKSTIVDDYNDDNLVKGYRLDFSSVSIDSIVLEGEPPAPLYNDLIVSDPLNGAYIILDVIKGSYYRIVGNFSFLKIDENNVAKVKYSTNNQNEEHTFLNTTDGRLLISFSDILNASPEIFKLETGEGIEEANKKQNIEDRINKQNIDTLLNENLEYTSLTLTSGLVSEIDSSNKLVDTSVSNASSFLLDIETYPIYNKVYLKGYAMNKYMIIYADSSRNVLGKEPLNLAFYGQYVYLNIPNGTKYIAFNFYDTINHSAEAKIMKIEELGGGSGTNFYTEINQDITLNQDGTTTPQLEQGYYHLTSGHYLDYYDQDGILQTDYDFTNGILYFNGSSQVKLTGVNTKNGIIDRHYSYLPSEPPLNSFWQETALGDSTVVKNLTGSTSTLRTSIPSTGNNNDTPTISAVRNYVNNLTGSFYTVISQNVSLNSDGTSNYTFTSGNYYLLDPDYSMTYYGSDSQTHSLPLFKNSILYYEETVSSKVLKRTGVNSDSGESYGEYVQFTSGSSYWYHVYTDYNAFVSNGYSSHLSKSHNTIPATGHDYDVPTIDAVRNYVANNSQNYSTTEHVVGTWISGKPLYEKTFQLSTPNVATDGTSAYADETLTNVAFGFIANAIVQYGASPYTVWSMPYYNDSMRYVKALINIDAQKLTVISNGTAYNGSTCYVTMRYTKTTD